MAPNSAAICGEGGRGVAGAAGVTASKRSVTAFTGDGSRRRGDGFHRKIGGNRHAIGQCREW